MPSPASDPLSLASASRQQQFLDVIDRDEAERRFREHLRLEPVGVEVVSLPEALNRVLAVDVASDVDVSGFDRSNVDGFAVRAADTFGATEEQTRSVRLNDEVLSPGIEPAVIVDAGTATTIATGGMLPRGADAVVMVEHTEVFGASGDPPTLRIDRAVSPGENLTFAGTDIACGETVLRTGTLLTSREIGVLAAIGSDSVEVYRRPRVAVVSTGDEIVPPGGERPPGFVYDSNLAILCATLVELGAEPVPLGIVRDDELQLEEFLARGLQCDAVVLSGGTSKGAGDLSYRVVSRLSDPGIVAHGVALKPGKPICLAASDGKPVVILPGFPTSAIFTFHEFVAPVVRMLAGRRPQSSRSVCARLPHKVNSDRGRTEYLLVALVHADDGLAAYPIGKGSGSVTTFSHADGFITIDRHTEIVAAGAEVDVQLLSESLEPADLVVIGSHCIGLDLLVGEMHRRGFSTKVLSVGSTAGLNAARRGECDAAGIHLLDPESGEYNRPFLDESLELIAGYRRMQSFVFRRDDARFVGKNLQDCLQAALDDADCRMANRNAGSGTRILIDGLLAGSRPPGYAVQAKSHNAVAAAVSQGRADWGIAIDVVARQYDLDCVPVQDECYDFAVPAVRLGRPAVRAFVEVLRDADIRLELDLRGLRGV